MSKQIAMTNGLIEALRTIRSPYPAQIAEFIGYLENSGHGLSKEGIAGYLTEIESRKRKDRKERAVSYSPAWYNQRIKAVKHAVRFLLNHLPDLTNAEKYVVEKYLQSIKLHIVKSGITRQERVPTREEVQKMIEAADHRLGMMIEFLSETGARITEALSAEIGKARRGQRITYLTIKGKAGKERDLRCRTELYNRIREQFAGSAYLFEHNGKQYSRIAVTQRIRAVAERTIGRSVSAHMLRHYRGTVLSEKLGISKAASELGHADIRTTKKFYDHTHVSEDEFLNTL